MAELDYAFLADYAAVQGGKLTAVGASFTKVSVGTFPTSLNLCVAGRVRSSIADDSCELKVRITSPDESFVLEGTVQMDPRLEEPYRDDMVGLLFSLGVSMPLPVAGLYEVSLCLDEVPVRVLRFVAEATN